MPPTDERQIMRALRSVGNVQPSPLATEQAMARVRAEVLSADSPRKNIRWRILMPASIAASIIATASLLLLTVSPREATAADRFLQSQKAMRAYNGWVRIENVRYSPQGIPTERTIESYVHPTRGAVIRIHRWETGHRIEFFDPPGGTASEYRSDTKTVYLSEMTAYEQQSTTGPPVTVEQVLGFIRREFGRDIYDIALDRNANLDRYTFTRRPLEGLSDKALELAHRYPPKVIITADVRSKLIQEVSIPGSDLRQVLTYRQDQIKDIFDLDLPPDVQVNDLRPQGPVKDLLDRLDRFVQGAWNDGVTVMTVRLMRGDSPDQFHEGGMVNVFARDGARWLFGSWGVSEGRGSDHSIVAPANWPDVIVDQLLPALYETPPLNFTITDGLTMWHPLGEGSREVEPPDWKQMWAKFSLPGRIWPTRESLIPFHAPRMTRLEYLTDPARPGLVGLRTTEYSVSLDTPDGAKMGSQMQVEYWLDPSRNDVPVEVIDKRWGQNFHREYLDFAKINGRWWPVRWQEIDLKHSDSREYTLKVFPDVRLGREWFTDPRSRGE